MWAAASLNYFGVGRDGKTAYERLKNKTFKLPMAEFGELVNYKIQSAKWKKRGKMNAKWGEGICLGVVPRANEYIVGTDRSI